LIQTQRRQIQRALTNGHERNVTGEDSGSTTMGEQQEDPAPALPPGSTAAA